MNWPVPSWRWKMGMIHQPLMWTMSSLFYAGYWAEDPMENPINTFQFINVHYFYQLPFRVKIRPDKPCLGDTSYTEYFLQCKHVVALTSMCAKDSYYTIYYHHHYHHHHCIIYLYNLHSDWNWIHFLPYGKEENVAREGQVKSVWVLLKLISETQLSRAAEIW